MAKYELFSVRQKHARGEVPDVFSYDTIPPALRIQVIHIWEETLGHERPQYTNRSSEIYGAIHNYLCHEYGCFALDDNPYNTAENKLRLFLGKCSTQSALDVIEVSFRYVDKLLRKQNERYALGSTMGADEAIDELNERFRSHGVGYRFESGHIVRVDSEFLHSEAVKPTLVLLSADEYRGANAEFLTAFEHYRKGNTKECLNECLKAFESTMKAICAKRNWKFQPTDTAKSLIDVCLKNKLIPDLIQSHLSGFRATLEGIPAIRNKLAAHGQGPVVTEVPMYFASYMLHLTATTIQFLVEAEKALK